MCITTRRAAARASNIHRGLPSYASQNYGHVVKQIDKREQKRNDEKGKFYSFPSSDKLDNLISLI